MEAGFVPSVLSVSDKLSAAPYPQLAAFSHWVTRVRVTVIRVVPAGTRPICCWRNRLLTRAPGKVSIAVLKVCPFAFWKATLTVGGAPPRFVTPSQPESVYLIFPALMTDAPDEISITWVSVEVSPTPLGPLTK